VQQLDDGVEVIPRRIANLGHAATVQGEEIGATTRRQSTRWTR
jgi:hypothetical protein